MFLLGGLYSLFGYRKSEWDCQKFLEKYIASVGKTESTSRSTCVCGEHSCIWATKVSMVYMPECCHTEHVWLEKKGKAAKFNEVQIHGRQASLIDIFQRLLHCHFLSEIA